MRYLGIDYGLRRVGLALSEGTFSVPFKIIRVKSLGGAVEQISQIVVREQIDIVVVGLPEAKMGKITIKFIKAIQDKGLNVQIADETLSSKNALQNMITSGVSKKKRKEIDAVAAAEILQNFLDNINK